MKARAACQLTQSSSSAVAFWRASSFEGDTARLVQPSRLGYRPALPLTERELGPPGSVHSLATRASRSVGSIEGGKPTTSAATLDAKAGCLRREFLPWVRRPPKYLRRKPHPPLYSFRECPYCRKWSLSSSGGGRFRLFCGGGIARIRLATARCAGTAETGERL
jgi:hypothetical protein